MNGVIENPAAPARPTQVLIVEDELIAAENIARNLKKQGYFVSAITDSGEEAIQLAVANRPDLVLMDIMLQGEMDGIQAAEHIQRHLNVPLIYMTAYGDDTTLERAKPTNPAGYIVKPFKPQNLKVTIEVALQNHRMQRQQTAQLSQQLQQAEQQLQTHHLYDPLTQLPNRRALDEPFNTFVQQWVQRSPAETQSEQAHRLLPILCLKIEHWQRINAYFSYQQSDELLKRIAQRLSQHLGEASGIAHLNADEFAILLPPVTHKREILQQARQLLQIFQHPFSLSDQSVSLSATIGVARYPLDGHSLDDLLKLSRNAIAAHAISRQQNPIVFHDEQDARRRSSSITLELALETDLQQALEHQELQIVYQPQVLLETDQIVGAEALLRWKHPQRGWIAPERFIPLAEKIGLMRQIESWLIEQVCHYQTLLLSYGFRPMHMSVNLAPSQFFRAALVSELLQLFARVQANPKYLTLEITEDTAIRDFVQSERQIKALKRIGLTIALDDFGKGYSSLIYLQKLPFDTIKIDRDFVRDIHQKPTNQTIVKALITMAHQLQLKIVGEGVETKEELIQLKALRCDVVQGYFTGVPMSGAEFIAFLTAQFQKKRF